MAKRKKRKSKNKSTIELSADIYALLIIVDMTITNSNIVMLNINLEHFPLFIYKHKIKHIEIIWHTLNILLNTSICAPT